MGDKWAERREARRRNAGAEGNLSRAAERGEPAAAGQRRKAEVVWGPERPASLRLAFVLWLVVGVPAVLGIVGILIVVAAVNLRAGFRGARVWLTVFGALAAVQFLGVLGLLLTPGVSGEIGTVLPLVSLVSAGVAMAATVAMWHPGTTAYFHELRRLHERVA